MEENIITCKVAVVGDPGVGKTNIIGRFVYNNYEENSGTTISSAYYYKKVDYKQFNKSISFDIWDTAGAELYRSLEKIFT